MKYLIDTCVISELIKPNKNQNVLNWIQSTYEEQLFLSVLSIGEINKGISKLPVSKKKELLGLWVEKDLKKRFIGRILGINEVIASLWGNIQGEAERKGKKMPVVDSLIAATAIVYDMVVVTRNIKDLEISGCKILNPWC